jgi:hypothetical protein
MTESIEQVNLADSFTRSGQPDQARMRMTRVIEEDAVYPNDPSGRDSLSAPSMSVRVVLMPAERLATFAVKTEPRWNSIPIEPHASLSVAPQSQKRSRPVLDFARSLFRRFF